MSTVSSTTWTTDNTGVPYNKIDYSNARVIRTPVPMIVDRFLLGRRWIKTSYDGYTKKEPDYGGQAFTWSEALAIETMETFLIMEQE